MAVARRVLTLLLAAAVALAPAGAAMAGGHAPAGKSASHSVHQGHAEAMHVTAVADQRDSGHCKKPKAADSNCCDDKATCALTCLQKCFGQTAALMPPHRAAALPLPYRFATRPAERPPGWSSAPQPPPPRV